MLCAGRRIGCGEQMRGRLVIGAGIYDNAPEASDQTIAARHIDGNWAPLHQAILSAPGRPGDKLASEVSDWTGSGLS
jgi:hypothetical protein